MTSPSDCRDCERVFMADPMMQAEVRHAAMTEGETAARLLLDDLLESAHESHGGAVQP